MKSKEKSQNKAVGWMPDIIGHGYEMCHILQGTDYSGDVRCTIIHKKTSEACRCGVLYIHGFSDYFFQQEMGDRFADRDYGFYAVDLRKYGRSYIDGQKMFQVKSLDEYFPDIQAGIDVIKEDGCRDIVLVGHSTGGLIASLYMNGSPDEAVKALVLNSPFLTWNLPSVLIKLGIPLLKLVARVFPNVRIKGDGTNYYAASIARHLGGEWTYDNRWKPDIIPDVDATWVRAIDNGHKRLRRSDIKVPVLLLHSDKSIKKGAPFECYKISDAVLDVRTMAAAGRHLGRCVSEIKIKDGLHDLVLSRKDVRDEVYMVIFRWLEDIGL